MISSSVLIYSNGYSFDEAYCGHTMNRWPHSFCICFEEYKGCAGVLPAVLSHCGAWDMSRWCIYG